MFRRKISEFKNDKSSANQGFTLIEMLVGIAIFAVGILAVGSMQISAINNNFSSKMRNKATVIAADHAEFLMAVPYGSFYLIDTAGTTTSMATEDHYNLQWSVDTDVVAAGTKSIRINVCWDGTKDGNMNCADSYETVTLDLIRVNI